MQTKKLTTWAGAALLGLSSFSAQAALVLYDYGFNIDGDVSFPVFSGTPDDPVPAEVDDSGFNTNTGLGSIDVIITGTGAHSFDAYFDIEIDEFVNTFHNETGSATGSAATGQSWEIDEPGWGKNPGPPAPPYTGDIYSNFINSSLDGTIFTNSSNTISSDDVAMAMGWDFSLALGQSAIINLTLSEIMPTSGFYLTQTDPLFVNPKTNVTESPLVNIYFSSSLRVIPEPSILLLMGIGIAGLAFNRRRLKKT